MGCAFWEGVTTAMIPSEPSVPRLGLTLFGPMQVLVQGCPLPRLRSRKALWLLALLTLRHDRPVQREWLSGILWPDMDQTQAFANLRPVVSELRSALAEEGQRLQSPNRHTLCLDLTGAQADILTFDAAVASGNLSSLERAVALYGGPLLEGCTEEWVFQERNAREQSCLQALQKLADAALSTGDWGTAIRYYQQAVGISPLWDAARRGWMEALARSGDTNTALQIYREFIELLKSDPKALPDEKTTALYQRLRSEARQRSYTPTAPIAETAPTPVVTGYLPHPLTELVGREDERVEVMARLHRSRLVTLTGLGGIGKTRLAMSIAAEVVKEFPNGAWLVALDGLVDGKLVAGQIASVLGLREEGGRTLLQSVTDHLRNKHLLLVLDNCEHLLADAAQVAGHLLQECAGVRILATSREALGIPGETAWAVPTLAVPDPSHLPPGRATLVRVLAAYESVQLFVERAQAVQKTFALTGSNALAVAQICAQLEGMPLAIEFAAARVKAMTVEQIGARLDNHLTLLAGSHRTALSRQQTLRATLDWSYALLNESERLLLHRLSVFVGGWNLDAAERVCAGPTEDGQPGIEAFQVLGLLVSLVDKSLVAFEERDSTGLGGRYRLLEMVRQYGLEKLRASGEEESIRARHRNWLLALAEEAEQQLITAEQGTWLHRLEAEHDNLRATLAWKGSETHGIESDLRLAGALYRFWYVRGYISEGREYLIRLLEKDTLLARTAWRAKALNGAGALSYSQGDYAYARTLTEESLSIRRELGDRGGIAWSLNNLGNIAYDQGDYTAARALHEESLCLRRELGEKHSIAWSLNSLGNIAHPQGDYATARALYEESFQLFQELGDKQGMARSYSCLGYVAFDQGDYVTARKLHEESLNLFRELGDRGGVAWACSCLGYMAYDQGEYVVAQSQLEEGRNVFRELGDRRGVAWTLNSLGNVAHEQCNLTSAQVLHEESLSIRKNLGDKQGIAWSLYCLGNVAHSQGAFPKAHTLLVEGIHLFQELGDRKGVAESLGKIAAVHLSLGDPLQAVRLWGATQSLREAIGSPLSPKEQVQYEQRLLQAHIALEEAAFAQAWEEGCALTSEQAMQGIGHRALG